MSGPAFSDIRSELPDLLGRLLGRPVRSERSKTNTMGCQADIDAVLTDQVLEYRIIYRRRASAEDMKGTLDLISACEDAPENRVLLILVPHMTEVGKKLLAQNQVSWFDLSGNAEITVPRLRVLVDGKKSRFPRPRRSPNLFSPKSARISRCLLIHPLMWLTQKEITEATGVSKGLTSRICKRLEESGLIDRSPVGEVRASDPDELLDLWQDAYQFKNHRILRGHLPARDGPDLLRSLAEKVQGKPVRFAFTGLGAAWLLSPHANFRLVSAYIEGALLDDLLMELGGREEETGGNLWLVSPNDRGVFQGEEDVKGFPTVNPVQVYLDLKDHPERSEEAAEEIRRRSMPWTAKSA